MSADDERVETRDDTAGEPAPSESSAALPTRPSATLAGTAQGRGAESSEKPSSISALPGADATTTLVSSVPAALRAEQAGVAAKGARVNCAAEDESAAALPAQPWSSIARSVVLASGIGVALVLFLRFCFDSGWVVPLLKENDLDMAHRMHLIGDMIRGAAAGLVALGTAYYFTHRSDRGLLRIEHRLWVLSPLLLLPTLPLFFAHQAWKDRAEALLPAVLVSALLLELLLRRALLSVQDSWRLTLARWFARVPSGWRRHGPSCVVGAATLAYWAFMSFYSLRWHQKLKTANFDLSINNNLIYRALHGALMGSTVVFPDQPEAYRAAHVKLGQFFFLPIYALHPEPETLLVLQAALMALGAVPLFAFARRHVSPWKAAMVSLAYLAYPPLHSANFFEFNYLCLAAVFVLATIWAADARRWVWVAIFFLMAASMREDIPIGLAVVGLFLLLSGYRARAGFAIAAGATVWFFVVKFHFMQQAGEWWFPKMYRSLWAPGEQGYFSLLKTLVTNPLFVLDRITESHKVYYLLNLLVPLAFLPARRWYLWAAFVPGALLTLLATDYKPPTMASFQYVMFWAPYLFVAAALALEALERGPLGSVRARAALVAMLFGSVVLSFNYGAFAARNRGMQSGYRKVEFNLSSRERQRYRDLAEIIRLIPPEASVAATEHVGPHVSSRTQIFSMRNGYHDAEYILAARTELALQQTKPTLKAALEGKGYGVIQRIGDFAVLKRGHDPSANRALLQDWGLQ